MSECMLGAPQVHVDLSTQDLLEHACQRGEGRFTQRRAFAAQADLPDSVQIVRINHAKPFQSLWAETESYLNQQDYYVHHGQAGADPDYALPLEIITELAWHSAAAQIYLLPNRPQTSIGLAGWTLLNTPGFGKPGIMINPTVRKILIHGISSPAAMFMAIDNVLSDLLPAENNLPLKAVISSDLGGQQPIVFLGPTEQGKILAQASQRQILGEPIIGWGNRGLFNFYQGCYTALAPLAQETLHAGSLIECSASQPHRAIFPKTYQLDYLADNTCGHPSALVLLFDDLSGVLPPIAQLTPEQARYYFAYTLSTNFPHPKQVYIDLFQQFLLTHQTPVYLVNTGGPNEHFSVDMCRLVVQAIIDQSFRMDDCKVLPRFNLAIPRTLPNIDPQCLDPRQTWQNIKDYDTRTSALIQHLHQHLLDLGVDKALLAAGPN